MPNTASDVFLGRQPIFDQRNRVTAYELLFRSSPNPLESSVTDDALATASVVRQAFGRIGIRTVVGGAHAFVNMDAEWLLGRRIESLPKDKVVIEILETVPIDEQLIRRCRVLSEKGYRLALDDFNRYSAIYEPLLEFVDIVKVDVLNLDPALLGELVQRLRRWPAKLLAEKIDTLDSARYCMSLGFDLFQGFHFGRPALVRA
jgi:EAL and modified HD-GYP domain-containing signal transduction protein